ncbi:uncharacterized protein LOC143152716 isoform X2 [Ptiloglossa arizonensis]|uniref:uncharacterized protein LOC143152716 isoform X2 n=1 Tax=Ptiloglossa arizonensis TaxID=3350558 RepID=UPI003FA01CE1
MRTHGRDKGADEERARGHEPAPTRSKMYPGRVEKGFPVPQARESERASERANDINNDSSECAQPAWSVSTKSRSRFSEGGGQLRPKRGH